MSFWKYIDKEPAPHVQNAENVTPYLEYIKAADTAVANEIPKAVDRSISPKIAPRQTVPHHSNVSHLAYLYPI